MLDKALAVIVVTAAGALLAYLRWKFYDRSKQHAAAANVALGIQRRFPDEVAGFVWRSISLEKLGCTQDAYENLEPVVDKFDGLGIVPYLLAVYAAELQQVRLTWKWLARSFATPDGKELKKRSLEEKSLEAFWRDIGEWSE